MKIALIGYGKMGKTIDELASEMGHEIVLKISSKVSRNDLIESQADVAIEFSTPASAASNIYSCFEANVPVVVGTTGWYDQFPAIEGKAIQDKQSLFYATNFSIGVNIFFELNRHLARVMNGFEDYAASMSEVHHLEKKDAPSGTAITLAEDIIFETEQKNKWVNEKAWKENELEIISLREEGVPGTHEITYSSDIDSLVIRHEAKSRKGFALGAIRAAEWLLDKPGVFTMKDLLKI